MYSGLNNAHTNMGECMKKKKSIKDYAEMSFLKIKKDGLNDMENGLIYEESQTGPQEEPTLKEIHLSKEGKIKFTK